jgi:hypothetical protein
MGRLSKADGLSTSLRNGDAYTTVIPAQAGIQYAAAYPFNHCCLWDTGSSAFADDDDRM